MSIAGRQKVERRLIIYVGLNSIILDNILHEDVYSSRESNSSLDHIILQGVCIIRTADLIFRGGIVCVRAIVRVCGCVYVYVCVPYVFSAIPLLNTKRPLSRCLFSAMIHQICGALIPFTCCCIYDAFIPHYIMSNISCPMTHDEYRSTPGDIQMA